MKCSVCGKECFAESRPRTTGIKTGSDEIAVSSCCKAPFVDYSKDEIQTTPRYEDQTQGCSHLAGVYGLTAITGYPKYIKKDNSCNICHNDDFEIMYLKKPFSFEHDYPVKICNVCGNIQKQIDIHEAH